MFKAKVKVQGHRVKCQGNVT